MTMVARGLLVSLFLACLLPIGDAAYACSPEDHCYGSQRTTGAVPSGFDGGLAHITPYCLGVLPGNFATSELWITDTVQYWVEVGFVYQSHWKYPDLPDGRSAFFADNRPGGGYHEHQLAANPALVRTVVQTHHATSDMWSVQVGNATGLSTSNTMTARDMQIGSEITADSSVHSLAKADGISYWKRPSWVAGLPQPSARRADPPTTLTWETPWTVMSSGAPC
jgi:hypothetical protein